MGHLKATVVHIRVTLGHLKVTIGYFLKANTTELHPKVRQTCITYYSLASRLNIILWNESTAL